MKNMILGLDVSTSKIGIAVMDYDKKIVSTDLIKFKTETSLEERAKLFENKLIKLKKHYPIMEVFVEEPFIAFGGGKTTAHTMAKLQRFNGEYVQKNHTEFTYGITAHGNPVPGTDDKADAIVIALYGLES